MSMLARARQDPVWWMNSTWDHLDLWSEQKKIVEAVRDHDEVAVATCHGIGKDYTAALIAIWFLIVMPVLARECPIARYIKKKFKLADFGISASSWSLSKDVHGEPSYAVTQFIRCFDDGDYPALEDRS